MARGTHPFPSRTRPLSPAARMVLLDDPVGEYVAASLPLTRSPSRPHGRRRASSLQDGSLHPTRGRPAVVGRSPPPTPGEAGNRGATAGPPEEAAPPGSSFWLSPGDAAQVVYRRLRPVMTRCRWFHEPVRESSARQRMGEPPRPARPPADGRTPSRRPARQRIGEPPPAGPPVPHPWAGFTGHSCLPAEEGRRAPGFPGRPLLGALPP